MLITADTDRFVKEIIEGNEYSVLFRDLTVIDLGCNIGTFSMWIYPLVKQIYALDLSSENIDNFNKTIEDNGLSKIKTFLQAIDKGTTVRYLEKAGDAGHGGWRLTDDKRDDTVPTKSLNQFMIDNDIKFVDILKIDIEGMEFEVLGGSDFPKDKIATIVGEVHAGMSGSLQAILQDKGYRYYDYGPLFVARK